MPFIKRDDSDGFRIVPTGNITAGTLVAVGTSFVGVASRDIPANTTGTLALEGVVFAPKPTGAGTAIDKGAKVYLFNGLIVTGVTGVIAGYADEAASTTDNTVAVLLWPGA